ncbi:transaldolase family protein [Bythopirellula polymerisocia]|uniref:Transaldolase n=1 Tax=Bythopirellula polymerisocia TaxID=2528003 RepID=A0A5C6CLL8_9BACT|nr:transaldolase family protein [Bythopirellula polymerisocia]TWU25510.1 Transaldolase [Bythopirellula polymerisocia]
MSANSITSLIRTGTKLWLDSVDPDLIAENLKLGATGATSNPIIISDLVKSGRYDKELARLLQSADSPSDAAWQLNDQVVAEAQRVFEPTWQKTQGDDGYVSFEVDPLLEDPSADMPMADRVKRYVSEGIKWSRGHKNRMIKVPATPAGIAALPELAAQGIPLNVTLIFTQRQYEAARDAVWEGAQRRESLDTFKSVYSIFISRVDVYTQKHVPDLSAAAQGQVGILNAKQLWQSNQAFWAKHSTPLKQEIVFASTGTKNAEDPPWKYVIVLAGSDIQTNPPATNDAVAQSDLTFTRTVDELPPSEVVEEIAAKVDMQKLEETLMREGIQKFADPQKALLALVEEKAKQLV